MNPQTTQCPTCLADIGEPCDFDKLPSLGSEAHHLTRHGRAASIDLDRHVSSDVVPFDVSQKPKMRERVEKLKELGGRPTPAQIRALEKWGQRVPATRIEAGRLLDRIGDQRRRKQAAGEKYRRES